MFWPAARGKDIEIKIKAETRKRLITALQPFPGLPQARLLVRPDRFQGRDQVPTVLDLDQGQPLAATRDKIDLGIWGFKTKPDNMIAFEHQKHKRYMLGHMAKQMRLTTANRTGLATGRCHMVPFSCKAR